MQNIVFFCVRPTIDEVRTTFVRKLPSENNNYKYFFLNMTIKNQQPDENAGQFLNMRRAGQGVKMLCGGHPSFFVNSPWHSASFTKQNALNNPLTLSGMPLKINYPLVS